MSDLLAVVGGYVLGSLPFGYWVPRLVRGEDAAAVVVLRDQPDPRQVADEGAGHDHAVADHELAVRAGDRVGHLDHVARCALGLA